MISFEKFKKMYRQYEKGMEEVDILYDRGINIINSDLFVSIATTAEALHYALGGGVYYDSDPITEFYDGCSDCTSLEELYNFYKEKHDFEVKLP